MDVFQTIFSFIVLISLIVGIHELGHFLTARYFGIHVLKFKIGFGKELFTLKDKKNCTYSFGILPLGGYVQMLGENNTYNEEDGHFMENKKSYNEASAGERAAVTVAGPVANFFLAVCIYSFLSFIGTMQLSSYVGEVLPNSIAEESGIKIKDKIVADGLDDSSFDVTQKGIHVNAKRFNELLAEEGTICLDMRNHYESEIGQFKGALKPDVDTFRESLPFIDQTLAEHDKEKKLLMYCTGGIRCEKASAYFKHKGFKNVFQLEGGIIEYARQVEAEGIENQFIGKNFVFDERRRERISDHIIAKLSLIHI